MKHLLSMLLFIICGIATAWAGTANDSNSSFSPAEGVMYALQESTTGLYLDIQTLGINEPNAGTTTNNISLNVKPCIIYFEVGSTEGTWKMKNINGSYVGVGTRAWNAVIGNSAQEWVFVETDNLVTISKAANNYINADSKVVGAPIYCDKSSAMQFSLVEYTALNRNYCALKSPTGTYLNFTTSGGTVLSFQETPSYLYITPSAGDAYYFESKDEAGKYIGSTHSWNATTDFSLWKILDFDSEGLALISRFSGSGNINLGHDGNTNTGTGIFTNVGSGCFKWIIEEKIDCPTAAISSNSKYYFTSENLWYTAPCNKLRFTLTESGAFYQNGAKRLSFDSFVLYDANGNEVALTESCFEGNNGKVYANMLDGENKTYTAGTWGNSAAEDDWFEITLPNDVSLGGAFSFSFVTENTTMNAKAFCIEILYEKNNYAFSIVNPSGTTATITYDGVAITDGEIINGKVDADLFTATDISGYTWDIEVDEENYTVILTYTAVAVVENPQAVVDLVNRIGGAGTADRFKFVHDPSLNSKNEIFILGNENGKVLIKGSTISAITTGLGWYLNHHANVNISWNSLNEKTVSGDAYANLSNLPLPATEKHISDAEYRYYLNYCTFGYSMTSWTWKRWQQEIDWMALHGINMPLQIVGLEEVWRKLLTMENSDGSRKYNYSDAEAKAFVAGPAFIAWWGMNNLEGWGGTAEGTLNNGTWMGAGGVQDDAWYVRQQKLASQILSRQRELGIEPVLPGFSGMVPTNFTSKTGVATDANGGKWAGGFQRPRIIDPTAARFAEIAADYYTCLKEVMGESRYYSMDPFHEGGSISSGKYSEAYRAIYDAMEAAASGSQWVIQQWQWDGNQKNSVSAVPEGRLIVLDLFSDGSPAFDSYSGYAPQDAVFCAIPNFGGRSGLMGRLNNLVDNYFKYKEKYASIKGIGAAPEAIEQTPVTYDLLFQLPWMGSKPDVQEWVNDYAMARYGAENAVVQEAWELLRQGVLNYGADGIQGPVEDVWAARPNLSASPASAWGKTLNHAGGTYTKARRQMLIDATYKLLSQSDALALEQGSIYESNYLYDLVEFGGGIMADYAYDLLLGINEAKTAAGDAYADDATYKARRDAFLALIAAMDVFKGTNLNFRLGKWTQEARDAAAEVESATTATPDWYEFNNARTIVSTWSSPNTNLNDYSYRSWQGLLKDYYLPRWQYYFDNGCTGTDYGFFEWNWAHGMEHYVGQTAISSTRLTEGTTGYSYTREPEGNTIEEATKLLDKYIIPVAMSDGTYYAYRYLTNDLTGKLSLVAIAGGTLDLTPYFGELTDATISGDFIDGDVADMSKIAIKADAADGAHIGTVTLADATVLTFAVVLNPEYYGVYKINYRNGSEDAPVFIAYNTDTNNLKEVGYKMIATGTYSTDTEADKLFTILPSGSGYSLSAQGMFLKEPHLSTWSHVMFSDNKGEAGVYLFEETNVEDLFKIRSSGNGNNYINDYDNLVFGNDASSKEDLSEFTFTEVSTYSLTVPADSLTTLCLPFNVVLPDNTVAYDLTANCLEGYAGEVIKKIALAGETLKAGTPAIIKAAPGTYTFAITMSDSNAKGSLEGSALKGTFLKQTLAPDDISNMFVLNGAVFERITPETTTVAANSCWLEADITENIVALEAVNYVKVNDWKFYFKEKNNGLTLADCKERGSEQSIVIPATYIVNGAEKNIIGISKGFMDGNEDMVSIMLPSTLSDLGRSYTVPYDSVSYNGDNVMHSPHYLNNTISNNDVWRMTVDVDVESTDIDFNVWGSAIFSTKENSLDDYYIGYMQLYLKNDHDSIIFKLDNADDRYTYGKKLIENKFSFILENDASDGFTANIVYEDGTVQSFDITAGASLIDFNCLYSSLPEGFNVDVKFERLLNSGLFVGCTNLKEIQVEDGNDSFSSIDGVLYNAAGTHIIRVPEGKTTFEKIDKKVTRIYAGALHDVEGDITFSSNPKISVITDEQDPGHHETHVHAVLHLDVEDEGAVDFNSGNTNTFETIRYERNIAEGVYGTIMLPFVPDAESLETFAFYELCGGDEDGLIFSEVENSEVKANKPYLYSLREGKSGNEMNAGKTTIELHADTVIVKEPNGVWQSVGCYGANEVRTDKGDAYYYCIDATDNKFYLVNKKIKTRPYRVYFMNSDVQTSAAPAKLSLRFRDGGTSVIDAVEVEGLTEPVYYDLLGRRILNPEPGIYIVNGRKEIKR